MAFKTLLVACTLASVSLAQRFRTQPDARLSFSLLNNEVEQTTPVPILRYIDTQNPDGSYTYGYESGDGTYKLETRYATGEVKGKYGYLDSNGKLREVEYGATPERGFEPRAEGLVLPPPTLDADYLDDLVEEAAAPAPAAAPRPEPVQVAAPVDDESAPRFDNFAPTSSSSSSRGRRVKVVRKKDRRTRLPIRGNRRPAAPTAAPRRAEPVPVAIPAVRPAVRSRPAPRPVAPAAPTRFVPQQPAPLPAFPSAQSHPSFFAGHPAQNIDLATGSFSVSYSGRK